MAFSNWYKEDLEKIFKLKKVKTHPILSEWLDVKNFTFTEFEEAFIGILKERITERIFEWNESDLITNFIAPLISLVDFYDTDFRYFSERKLSGKVGEYDLSGDVNGLIAYGKHKPKKPFFCFLCPDSYREQTRICPKPSSFRSSISCHVSRSRDKPK